MKAVRLIVAFALFIGVCYDVFVKNVKYSLMETATYLTCIFAYLTLYEIYKEIKK